MSKFIPCWFLFQFPELAEINHLWNLETWWPFADLSNHILTRLLSNLSQPYWFIPLTVVSFASCLILTRLSSFSDSVFRHQRGWSTLVSVQLTVFVVLKDYQHLNFFMFVCQRQHFHWSIPISLNYCCYYSCPFRVLIQSFFVALFQSVYNFQRKSDMVSSLSWWTFSHFLTTVFQTFSVLRQFLSHSFLQWTHSDLFTNYYFISTKPWQLI